MKGSTQAMKGAEVIDSEDVSFNPEIIAAAWEAFENGIPAVSAAAIVNEMDNTPTVNANDGEEVDRDVHFEEQDILVEEKAMGVCAESTAEEYAPGYIKLDREDGKVLALNLAQVFY
jgi:hypothetical protein